MRFRPDSPLTAKIIKWNDDKGFGFLAVGRGQLFLHRRDFAERHKQPAVGDVICFTPGVDAKGRTCAKNAVHVNDGGRITVWSVVLLAGLLVLPAIAVHQRGIDFRWVSAYVLVISAISYGSYVLDKRRARAMEWRISEARLHVTELLGGWPGAFLAQRRLRHKCSKVSYQMVFWLIVLVWQFAAFDSLQNWRSAQAAIDYYKSLMVDGNHHSGELKRESVEAQAERIIAVELTRPCSPEVNCYELF